MITKDMSITEIISKYPETREVFFKHQLGCIGCRASAGETIEAGLKAHGLDVDAFIKELNEVINKNKKDA